MNPVFLIAGVRYNVSVPAGGIQRQGRVLDGPNVSRTQDGGLVRYIIGTYYNYVLQIETDMLALEDYDALYEALSAPKEYHDITVPYGQGTLTFRAYIPNLADTLTRLNEGRRHWGGLAVTNTATLPHRGLS